MVGGEVMNSIQKRNQEDPTIRFYGAKDSLDESLGKYLSRRKKNGKLRKAPKEPKGNR